MRIAVEMQRLSPEMDSAVIIGWLKQVGDYVEKGDPLVEIETEKIDVEMEALDSGILTKILKDAEAEVRVGEVIAYMDAAYDLSKVS